MDKDYKELELLIEAQKSMNDSYKNRVEMYKLIYKFGLALVLLVVLNLLLWSNTVSNQEFLLWLKGLLGITLT